MATTTTTAAHLTEVFSSVQGEGPYVGVRQLFLRFYGCHRRCEFCDSPETVTAWQAPGFRPASGRVEWPVGSQQFETFANPLDVDAVLALIQRFQALPGHHHSLAVTGGEPLLHAGFLAVLLPRAQALGWKTYLETAGDLYHELERVLPGTDIVAMDIKLPSVTGNEPSWGHHRHFLARCRAAQVEVFAKAIVGVNTTDEDIRLAAEVVASAGPGTPLILQPLTPFGPVKSGPRAEQLLRWQALAQSITADVRVIPQCHKMMGQL